jgi:hypothetical protein
LEVKPSLSAQTELRHCPALREFSITSFAGAAKVRFGGPHRHISEGRYTAAMGREFLLRNFAIFPKTDISCEAENRQIGLGVAFCFRRNS